MKAITRKTKFLIIAVIIGAVYTVVGGKCAHEKGIADFKKFNENDVVGTVQNFYDAQLGPILVVKDKNYHVTGLNNVNNRDDDFIETVKRGDSVIKKKYSDSLILIHSGKRYYYTFEKILPTSN